MGNALDQTDGALQTTAGPLVATTGGLNFAGVGQGDYGFSDQYAPPDTNGAVGATQYVQWVNTYFAVFDKATGAIAAGFPKPGNSRSGRFRRRLPDQQRRRSDRPVRQAGQPLDPDPVLGLHHAVPAVRGGFDDLGCDRRYYRYAFSYGNTQFNDYPKLGVWPDGYYISYNIFNNAQTFAGSKVCAFDRTKMLAGDPTATQQCFQLSTSYGGLLPSDLDGADRASGRIAELLHELRRSTPSTCGSSTSILPTRPTRPSPARPTSRWLRSTRPAAAAAPASPSQAPRKSWTRWRTG